MPARAAGADGPRPLGRPLALPAHLGGREPRLLRTTPRHVAARGDDPRMGAARGGRPRGRGPAPLRLLLARDAEAALDRPRAPDRSEERRVGKECGSRWTRERYEYEQ